MTAAQLELITAAVDGELSATEQRAFRALLASSAEARELFGRLKADSLRVAALPRVAPPVDLQARIMARIAATTPAPASRPKTQEPPAAAPATEPARKLVPAHAYSPAPRRTGRWVPAALAASVLLCITAASFAFFRGAGPKNQISKGAWANVLPYSPENTSAVPSPTGPTPDRERPDPASVARADVSPVPPVPNPREAPAPEVATAPAPRTVNPDFIGSPFRLTLPPFERVEIRIPFLRPAADLGREDIAQELTDELRRDPTRLDLFVRDTARGVEVFQNTAKAAGLAVHVDAATLDKLKKKQAHSVVIYTESLSAAELAALFAKLSAEDSKYSPRVCDSLHANAVVRSDELELKAILGLDVGLYKRPSAGVGQGGDRVPPGKSVNAGTIDQVVQSVSGVSPSASAKGPDKHAVLLTWQTAHPNLARTNPASSAELKQYLQKRGARPANAVPALIVIRPVG